MLSKFIPGHLAFMTTTVFIILVATYLFLLWQRKWMVKHSIDPNSKAAGVYSTAWAIAYCSVITTVWEPIQLIFERMSTMALSAWDTVQFIAFQITMPTLFWYVLMRLVIFVFTWLNGLPSVAVALKEEQYGRVLPLAAVMVLTSWLLAQSIAPLAASFLPYPAVPLFK